MQGKILAYEFETRKGVISGSDGVRYDFSGDDFKAEGSVPRVGGTVDFDAQDNAAVSIYPVASDNPLAGDKNKIVAALLAFFLGMLGVHKFYLGKTTAGIIMLICGTIGWILIAIPPIIVGIIAFIEFIIYLTKSDQDFHDQYVVGNKAWF